MPDPYNTHIIVNVFRSIVQLISLHPELLNTPGVFRVAGAKEEIGRLLKQLISEQFNVNTLSHYVMEKNKVDSEHLHNILGMIPAVFKDSQILDSEDSLLVDFSKELKSVLNSQPKNATQLLDNFIRDLLLSKRIDHQRAGEILDHYCYLMHQAGIFQNTNRMTYRNLAIIMAPGLTQNLDLFPAIDFLGLSGFISQLTPVLENYITDKKWSDDFKERHVDKLKHLASTRHSIREQLEHMKEASRNVVVVPMKSLMLQAATLKAQIESIEKQQHDHSMKRKVKKELREHLKQLKEELHGLNLKISELIPQISMMNHGYQQIQEEIKIISLSEDGLRPGRKSRNKFRGSNLTQFSIFESDIDAAIPEELKELAEYEETDYDHHQSPDIVGPG